MIKCVIFERIRYFSRKKGSGNIEKKLPVVKEGCYECLYRLFLRDKAGLNGKRLCTVPEKTVVEIIEIKYLSVSIWGKTKEGWLCMYMNETFYVKET